MMSESSRTPSPCQRIYMNTIRQLVVQPKCSSAQIFLPSKQIIFYPPNYMGEKPNASVFYLKPVIVCVLHIYLFQMFDFIVVNVIQSSNIKVGVTQIGTWKG